MTRTSPRGRRETPESSEGRARVDVGPMPRDELQPSPQPPAGGTTPPGADDGLRALEARLRALERSLEAAHAELARMRASRWYRLACRYWSVRSALAAALYPALHPREWARTAATRWLPYRVRRRLIGLFRRRSQASPVAPAMPTTPAEAPSPRPAAVFLSAVAWDFRLQRPQHLARRLAALGWDVWFVGPELAAHSAEDARAREGEPLAPGVRRLALPAIRDLDLYRAPPDRRSAAGILAALRDWQRRYRYHDVATVCQLPTWAEVALRLREELGWPLLYDLLDLHEAFGEMEGAARLERRLLEAADRVTATSEALELRARRVRDTVRRLPNACDWAFWSRAVEPPPLPGISHPVIGYFGAIADWFDTSLVEELATRRPSWSFVLIGDTRGGRVARLRGLPNVHMLGERPYEELPALARTFDVAVIPFVRSPLTEATDPVKLYELMALGLDVVSTPLPEVAARADALGLRIAATPAEFLEEIEAALANPPTPALIERRLEFARGNDWSVRAEELERILRGAFPLVSVIVVSYENLPLTRACLESVLGVTSYPNFEVVVVDNASTDGTPEYLRELATRERRVRVALNPENRGFAAACNQGARLARGEVICFLNNDTVVSRGWLSALVRALRADPRLGLVGAVTNDIGNEARIAVGYSSIEAMPEWAERWSWSHRGERRGVPMVALFCAALRREVWEAVGELDERFGIGMFEDDDYSLRVRRAGYTVAVARDAYVHHWHQAAFRLLGEERYADLYEKNRRLFRAKWSRDARRTEHRGDPT